MNYYIVAIKENRHLLGSSNSALVHNAKSIV